MGGARDVAMLLSWKAGTVAWKRAELAENGVRGRASRGVKRKMRALRLREWEVQQSADRDAHTKQNHANASRHVDHCTVTFRARYKANRFAPHLHLCCCYGALPLMSVDPPLGPGLGRYRLTPACRERQNRSRWRQLGARRIVLPRRAHGLRLSQRCSHECHPPSQ